MGVFRHRFPGRALRRLERDLRDARAPLATERTDAILAAIGGTPAAAPRRRPLRLAAALALTAAFLGVAAGLGGVSYASSAASGFADTVRSATGNGSDRDDGGSRDFGGGGDRDGDRGGDSDGRGGGGSDGRGGGRDDDEVTICHGTGSDSNPYVKLTVSEPGLDGHDDHPFDLIPAPASGCHGGGHGDHPGQHQYGGKIPICHRTGSSSNPYVLLLVPNNIFVLLFHWLHGDIIPAPSGGCPSAPEPDRTAPSGVGDLTATGADGPPRVLLAWDAATDDRGVVAYDVTRDGAPLTSTSSLSTTDAGVEAGRTYTYSVRARDAAGNVGAAATATVTVPDTTPPSVPARPDASVRTRPLRVVLDWNPSTDNVGVTAYRVYRDGTQVATVSATAWTDASVKPKRTYRYSVAAVDAAGNTSEPSAAVTVKTPKS